MRARDLWRSALFFLISTLRDSPLPYLSFTFFHVPSPQYLSVSFIFQFLSPFNLFLFLHFHPSFYFLAVFVLSVFLLILPAYLLACMLPTFLSSLLLPFFVSSLLYFPPSPRFYSQHTFFFLPRLLKNKSNRVRTTDAFLANCPHACL